MSEELSVPVSSTTEVDSFEDAVSDNLNVKTTDNDDLNGNDEPDQELNSREEQNDVTSVSSKKKKKKNKKKNNKGNASSSQLDLTEQEELDEKIESQPQQSVNKSAFQLAKEAFELSNQTSQSPEENKPSILAEEGKQDEQDESSSNIGVIEPQTTRVADDLPDDVEPPLSKSTDKFDDTSELENENRNLEAKLQELNLLESSHDDLTEPSEVPETPSKPDETSTDPIVTPTEKKKVPPQLPFRAVVANPTSPPSLPPRDSPVESAKILITSPPPVPQRNSTDSNGLRSFKTKSAADLPPPPLPPQLTSAQKAHHRTTNASSGGVLQSWFSRPPTSSRTSNNSLSEKSIDYDENYDLLLSRLTVNTDEYQSKDESSKEQITTGQDSLRTTFAETKSKIETKDQETSNELDDDKEEGYSELNKIDWPFWTRVVDNYSAVVKSDPSKLSKEISNGVPSQIRGIIWQLVANSNPKEFEQVYTDLQTKESPFEKSIQKDLSRTSFNSDSRINHESLYRIIKAYSIHDSEVGYTQGMAFITVPLLLNMNELESFSLLHELMHGYNIRSLYLPEMPGLLLTLYEFDRLLEDLLPNLHAHLLRQGVRSSMYASQWFLTFFAYKFPLEFVLRIFDLIITEGFESILKFAIALVQKNETILLTLKFDELLEFLKESLFNVYSTSNEEEVEESEENKITSLGDFFKKHPAKPITVETYNVDQLVEDATNVKILPITLNRYKEEYEEIHRLEKERKEEIEEIRFRNNQLRREIKNIESSYTILNREHVQIANEMINGRMKIATLEDENKELSEQNQKLRERVKSLQNPSASEEVPVPSSLEEDLKKTMERNLEVMTQNQELEDQVSSLLQEVENLKSQLQVKEEEIPTPVPSHTSTSPNKGPKWPRGFFK